MVLAAKETPNPLPIGLKKLNPNLEKLTLVAGNKHREGFEPLRWKLNQFYS
jgi:hypothetical protein